MADMGTTVAESISAKRLGAVAGVPQIRSVRAEVALMVGRFVCQGTADDQVKAVAAAGDVTETGAGIVRYVATLDWTADTCDVGDTIDVVRKGLVWVTTEDAVAAGQTAFVRITADAGGPAGAARPVGNFRSDADGGEATESTRIRYVTSTTGIGLALVEVDLP